MEVKRAATAGFCMGVSLALHKLDTAIRKNGRDGSPASRICTFGPIIHNPQVLRGYEEKGVACLRDPAEARAGDAVIIRAHGVPRGEELLLKSCVVIAGCPTGIVVPILTLRSGRDAALASNSVIVTTLLSLITLPVLLMLLG